MSAIHVIGYVGLVVIIAGAAVRIWRGEVPRLRDEPGGWPWGQIAWRAYVRCVPSLLLPGTTILVVLPVLESVPERADGSFDRPVLVVVPVLAAFALSVLVVLCVAVFNRPKFLVARELRHEPGAATEILARRRRRR